MKAATTSLAILLIASAGFSFADSLPDKLVMPTDVGKIVITVEPCGINYGKQVVPFKHHAYATELKEGMEIIHPGCWHREGMAVNIHFPEVDAVASYKVDYFKPESKK